MKDRKELLNLIEVNSESLSNDLKTYLEKNNYHSEYEVSEVYPLLYDSLFKILNEQFNNFNIENKYTKEIETNRFSNEERRNYYVQLYFDTIHKIILYKTE